MLHLFIWRSEWQNWKCICKAAGFLALGLFSSVSLGTFAGSWMRSAATWTQLCTLVWDISIAPGCLTHCSVVPAPCIAIQVQSLLYVASWSVSASSSHGFYTRTSLPPKRHCYAQRNRLWFQLLWEFGLYIIPAAPYWLLGVKHFTQCFPFCVRGCPLLAHEGYCIGLDLGIFSF